jgi:hypothetical protein
VWEGRQVSVEQKGFECYAKVLIFCPPGSGSHGTILSKREASLSKGGAVHCGPGS